MVGVKMEAFIYQEDTIESCGKTVSHMILFEESQDEDPYMGFLHGIQSVNQRKQYVSSNAMYFEHNRRKDLNNQGFLNCSLMIYYLRDEPDFPKWWNVHNHEPFYTGY